MDEEPHRAGSPEATPATPPRNEEEWSVRYKYLLADFENYRRRTDRERESLARQTRAEILRELIPLYEAFVEARKATAGSERAITEGIDLLAQEWQRFLTREGVVPVAVVGEPFAAEEEEAVAECAADSAHPDGSVAEIVQQGYRFSGGLLRPAKIVVARASSDAGGTDESTDADEPGRSSP